MQARAYAHAWTHRPKGPLKEHPTISGLSAPEQATGCYSSSYSSRHAIARQSRDSPWIFRDFFTFTRCALSVSVRLRGLQEPILLMRASLCCVMFIKGRKGRRKFSKNPRNFMDRSTSRNQRVNRSLDRGRSVGEHRSLLEEPAARSRLKSLRQSEKKAAKRTKI